MVSHVTTPVPSLHAAKSIQDRKLSVAIPLATLRVTMETSSHASNNNNNKNHHYNDDADDQPQFVDDDQKEDSTKIASEDSTKFNDDEINHVESITTNEDDTAAIDTEMNSEKIEETTSVEQRLKRISEEIEKYRNVNINDNNNNNNGGGVGGASVENHGPQSFLYLTDLLNTLRPSEKKVIPQIDSDYSNTMHVLGETTSIVSGDDTRKIKTMDLRQTNRALY